MSWPAPIATSQRLPAVNEPVLGFQSHGLGWYPAIYLGQERGWYVRGVTGQIVSHWLPKPPNPEQES